ncbi:tetratricopeptide repeat protein [Almyronema epifaneia]|uniref:Tetratricopeptide repeat protein n=1 Tax=Almyronema epifaneia S1 TaxID=2991925 RepID=A0ABW6IET3_9CYAN
MHLRLCLLALLAALPLAATPQLFFVFDSPFVAFAQTPEDRLTEADRLLEQGIEQFRVGSQFQAALQTWQTALAIYQNAEVRAAFPQKSRAGEGRAYGYMGNAYLALGQYFQAIELYEQDLAIAREIADRTSESRALGNLGNAYLSLGQYRRAIELYEQDLAITQTLREIDRANATLRANEGVTLGNLASAYLSLSRYGRAIELYEQQLAIARETGDRAEEARSLGNLGVVYLSLGQYSRALELLEQDLAIAREMSSLASEGFALGNLGSVYNALGQYPRAIEHFEQQLAIAREINDRAGEGNALGNLGSAYLNLSQFDRAIEHFEQQLAIAREIGDRADEANALGNLGNAYQSLDQYPHAIELYNQQLALTREIGIRRGEGSALGNLGNVYLNLSQYSRALKLFEEQLAISQEIGNRSSEGSALGNLGNAYFRLGQYPQAIELFSQSLAIDQAIGDRAGESASLGNLGNVHFSLGQYQRAIEFYQQDLHISREIGNRVGEGSALGSLGVAYLSLNQLNYAIELFDQRLAVARELGDRTGEGNGLVDLGAAYFKLGQYSRAIELYQQGLAIVREVGDREIEGDTLNNLGYLFQTQGQSELAIALYKQSVNVRETIRQEISDRSLLQSYTDTVAGTYRRLADLLLEQGRILEAQQVLELLKIQEIQDYTDQRAGEDLPNVTLLPKEEELIGRFITLVEFGKQLRDCEAARCNALTTLRAERNELFNQYRAAITELESFVRERLAADETLLNPTLFASKAEEIIRAQPGTVIIYPLVLEDKLWLLWATDGRLQSKREIDVDRVTLGNTAIKFRELLENRNSDIDELQATAQQLYTWLIAPIEAELAANQEIQHLVFSLDRTTRYLPMAALHDGQQYLIEKYTVTTILSAALTNYNERVPIGTENVAVLGAGVSEASVGFNALANVPVELDGIIRETNNPADTAGIYPGQALLNPAFTFEALQNALSGMTFLHIATHGTFIPGRRDESFLVMGNEQRLPIPEIETLGTYLEDVHLVVLSACETALGGSDEEGLEIAGLGYYFLKNRPVSVLASLWNVNDRSTSLLMQQFYANLAAGTAAAPITKAAALRDAQLALLGSDALSTEAQTRLIGQRQDTADPTPLSHPYHWAPFILIGNGL